MLNRRRDDPVPPELAGIPSRVEKLRDYSELNWVRTRVYRPDGEADLGRILAYANAAKRRVTIRAGGHSFDTQSLGTGLVVSMQSFDTIAVRHAQEEVEVGSGATWGAILAELAPHGLVPAVTVTTEHATAGGTLSGDCLSRFSPAYGKEGTHVKRFVMMTPEGRVITCTPPQGGPPQTLEERLFLGAIGGLGYLGPILSITYGVLPVGPAGSSIRVKTTVRKHSSFRDLADDLVPDATTMRAQSDPADEAKKDAIYSALYRRRGGPERVLVLRSTFTTSATGRSMLLFRPKALVRVPVEWLIRWTTFNALLWWCAWKWGYSDRRQFVDRLAGFTFFMDGNTRAKHIAGRFGIRLKTLQQTFVVPADVDDLPATQRQLTDWLAHATVAFDRRRLTPTFHDMLFLPRDMPFLLSATADTAGFAVSYAFETGRGSELRAVETTFEELADDLWNRFGGRVYLVKDVRATTPTLRAMYGQNAVAFSDLKREVDPHDIMRNEFLDRTLCL
jgi:decaprenylphospho-beta-D-ribofuranose 2-oxidase